MKTKKTPMKKQGIYTVPKNYSELEKIQNEVQAEDRTLEHKSDHRHAGFRLMLRWICYAHKKNPERGEEGRLYFQHKGDKSEMRAWEFTVDRRNKGPNILPINEVKTQKCPCCGKTAYIVGGWENWGIEDDEWVYVKTYICFHCRSADSARGWTP